jgi:putative transposase
MTREELETRRLEAAELLTDGVAQAEVARRKGVSRTTAWRWAAAIQAGRSLARRRTPGRPSRMTAEQVGGVRALWLTRPRWTTEAFAQAIGQAVGVKYHRDHVCKLIRQLGLREKRYRAPQAARPPRRARPALPDLDTAGAAAGAAARARVEVHAND